MTEDQYERIIERLSTVTWQGDRIIQLLCRIPFLIFFAIAAVAIVVGCVGVWVL